MDSSLLLAGWNADVIDGVAMAMLDHKGSVGIEDVFSRTIK